MALNNTQWHSSGRVANNWQSGCPLVKLTQIWSQWQWIGLSGIRVVQWHLIGYHMTLALHWHCIVIALPLHCQCIGIALVHRIHGHVIVVGCGNVDCVNIGRVTGGPQPVGASGARGSSERLRRFMQRVALLRSVILGGCWVVCNPNIRPLQQKEQTNKHEINNPHSIVVLPFRPNARKGSP